MIGRVAVRALGLVTALGHGVDQIWPRLLAGDQSFLTTREDLVAGRPILVGAVPEPLPGVPDHLRRFACRNNRLALAAIGQMEPAVRAAIEAAGPDRTAVVMGTSTSGTSEAEEAVACHLETGDLPRSFELDQFEFGGLAEYVAAQTGARGPAYTISTACSSAAKALGSARALLTLGLCDVAIAGGADSLCRLTATGFDALQAMSDKPSNPFSANRRGLMLGEGAAVFLLTREPGRIELVGVGEASDAFHMSAPEPGGLGAEAAMRAALDEAGIGPAALRYLNLHGTGTPLNDAMESLAVHRLFGGEVPCSSTKPLTGHALGASGALELAFCHMMLDRWDGRGMPLLPHCWDGVPDPELPILRLAQVGEESVSFPGPAFVMSNSFGFGGNNCALLLRAEPP